LIARFKVNYVTRDAFLTQIPVSDGKSKMIYTLIKSFFIIIINNIQCLRLMEPNVMMGERSSVTTLLKNDVPELFVFKCIFHSFVLCTSYACKKLPYSIENLVREMFKSFQYSAKKAS
jgi:hypothetical protein